MGRLVDPDSTNFVKWFQLALWKFYLLTGLVGIGSMGLTGMMTDGLCWDLGKQSRIIWCGKDPFRLAKAKSGLDVFFHLHEKNLSGCFW